MKEKTKIILMSLLFILSIASIVTYKIVNQKEDTKDAIQFKEEYEALNGVTRENTDKIYTSMDLPTNNPMYYATYEEIYDVLEGTGVIYLGYPECPWCRNLVPTLIESAKKVNIDKIYYMNMHDERNKLVLNDDGEIETEQKGSEGYNTLVEKIKDVLPVYEGLNDDSIKRIYVPFVIFVKDGEITDTHMGTLDSQENPYEELTSEQKTELKNILVDKMMKISDSACDDLC